MPPQPCLTLAHRTLPTCCTCHSCRIYNYCALFIMPSDRTERHDATNDLQTSIYIVYHTYTIFSPSRRRRRRRPTNATRQHHSDVYHSTHFSRESNCSPPSRTRQIIIECTRSVRNNGAHYVVLKCARIKLCARSLELMQAHKRYCN